MKKGFIILLLGLIAGVGAFAGGYLLRSAAHRHMLSESKPELAWLKEEFKLTDAEFARISELHEAYLPACRERCRVIQQQNEKLEQLMAQSATVTPEIEKLLAARAKTRAECEAAMLKHFMEVAKAMPLEQGKRYLTWVKQQSSLHGQSMERSHAMDMDNHQM